MPVDEKMSTCNAVMPLEKRLLVLRFMLSLSRSLPKK